MIKRRFIFFILVILICTMQVSAMESNEFSHPQLVEAAKRIQLFLQSGKVKAMDEADTLALEVDGLVAIHLILKQVVKHLSTTPVSSETKPRIDLLLRLASHLAQHELVVKSMPSSRQDELLIKQEIKSMASQLLAYFRLRSNGQHAVVEIYDELNLWDQDDFWFFQQYARNPSALSEHYFRIKTLIPSLSTPQLMLFVGKLRKIRPYDIAQLTLLMDAGMITEPELKAMLRLATDRFIEMHTTNFDEVPATKSKKQREDQIIAAALIKLRSELHTVEHSAFMAILAKARSSAQRARPSPERELRLRLYDLVTNDQLIDTNPTVWWSSSSKRSLITDSRTRSLSLIEDIEDNVIFVRFGSTPSRCRDRLK